ncbi:hypothetical protein [Actinomadura madurae]|uniref:hypothetical protein n=1 Tax=Actinomadura madurae TaxID=1993 RepID=UPI0020D24142|nr:hypothetical protein [Actinomadura madurae]MCP9977886.1 hypothetical protein [Actinomadura madurae]
MKGNGEAQLSYRLLLAVDIQGYSRRDTREQLRAQRLLSDALDRAARGVGLDRAGWDKQVGGDGELATLPDGVDPATVARRLRDRPRRGAARGQRGRRPAPAAGAARAAPRHAHRGAVRPGPATRRSSSSGCWTRRRCAAC